MLSRTADPLFRMARSMQRAGPVRSAGGQANARPRALARAVFSD
jgi:hypothetical protein